MQKERLQQVRESKGYSLKEFSDLIGMELYSYRRREKGKIRISNKEWQNFANALQVDFDDIFEPDYNYVNINNGDGQINNNTQKIQYYNVPKDIIDNQLEYINILKSEIETLKNDNSLKELRIKELENKN